MQHFEGIMGCWVGFMPLGGDSVSEETWHSRGSCENHLEEEKEAMW